jgi:hypothetical protein
VSLGLAPLPASAARPDLTRLHDSAAPALGAVPDGGAAPEGWKAPSTSDKPTRTGEEQRQGNVVAVIADPVDPLIVIEVENGYLTVRLRCGSLCPSVHLGDYVVVEGERRSEAVLDASEVWVATP